MRRGRHPGSRRPPCRGPLAWSLRTTARPAPARPRSAQLRPRTACPARRRLRGGSFEVLPAREDGDEHGERKGCREEERRPEAAGEGRANRLQQIIAHGRHLWAVRGAVLLEGCCEVRNL